jgi:hypothetical protein
MLIPSGFSITACSNRYAGNRCNHCGQILRSLLRREPFPDPNSSKRNLNGNLPHGANHRCDRDRCTYTIRRIPGLRAPRGWHINPPNLVVAGIFVIPLTDVDLDLRCQTIRGYRDWSVAEYSNLSIVNAKRAPTQSR